MSPYSSHEPSRARALREQLQRTERTILMEAHNGLSAKLAAEAGFSALWASSLAISAALGVRDCNEASWTQVLEVLEFMTDATQLPILLDGDTGYGNFNNVRRLVRKLEQRAVAGVCLEDKLFPKTNSLIAGQKQRLAEIDEFCGKLRAAKDTQRDADFVVVARTEALIAGWGVEEAQRRAYAYAAHGADAILVHSDRRDGRDILAFMHRWDGRVPIVIVPTTYPSEALATFTAAGVNNFIFANQALRSVITALQTNLRRLRQAEDLMAIESDIAPWSEVFRLQNTAELAHAETRYLPPHEHVERSSLGIEEPEAEHDERSGAQLRAGAASDRPTMHIEQFGAALRECGVVAGTGVPCSYFTPLVSYAGAQPWLDYVSAASEGEAVAIAAGMVAAGTRAFVLMQNSGLGNAVNPITSLLQVYQIPLVLLVSLRGEPGTRDEPQHVWMGQITESLALLCGLRTHRFDPRAFGPTLRAALAAGESVAYVVPNAAFEGGAAAPDEPPRVHHVHIDRPWSDSQWGGRRLTAQLTREQALQAILPLLNRELGPRGLAVVSTTGKLSRELYELDDREHDKRNRFYMVGSMGCAASFGFGVARARSTRQVLVLDGDGALLMKLGTLATIGHAAPENYHHVTFDNGAHDSTGGQPTASVSSDLGLVALACGFRCADTVADADALKATLERHLALPGPTFLRVIIRTGARPELGRPALTPRDNYLRFTRFLQTTAEP